MAPSRNYEELSDVRRERAGKILRAAVALRSPTRDALQNRIGLSAASIAKYTQLLTEQEILLAESAGVGRTLEYRINPEFGEFVAVVAGRTVHAVTVNAQGTITARSSRTILPENLRPEAFVETVMELTAPLLTARQAAGARILACGVAIGGYIDPVSGVSHDFYNREHWHRFALAERITESLGLRTFLINDANAATLGERYYGSARDYAHFILVWMGEGLGMGIVTNGRLYTGASFYAGELGHTVVPGNDRLCYCGSVGCLETVCSEQYARQRYQELVTQVVGAGRPMGLDHRRDREATIGPDLAELVAHVQDGDRFARRVFDEMADALIPKLTDVANLFNPAAVVLRGPMVDHNPYFSEAIRRRVINGVLRPVADNLTIYAPHDQDAPGDSVEPNGRGDHEGDDVIAKGVAAQALLDFLDGVM